MLTNSDIYLCTSFSENIASISPRLQLSATPKNMVRLSQDTIITCNHCPQNQKTQIILLKVVRKSQNAYFEQQVIQEFEGIYTNWVFFDQTYALLTNKEGDFLFYNFLDKTFQRTPKQHPGFYRDPDLFHTNQHFISCGGNFKNLLSNNLERIVKIWEIDQNENLVQRARINTGHKKAIEYSFLVNGTLVVSASSDKSIRITNLVTEQIQSVIYSDFNILSGAQIDYNTIMLGGSTKDIKIYDFRSKKQINGNIKVNEQISFIGQMSRFTEKHMILSNINSIYSFDLRNWGIKYHGKYEEGEVNCQILGLNQQEFVVGNRNKSVQIWKGF